MGNIPIFGQSDFKKSTFTIYNCVQVAHKDGVFAVGDTKNPKQAYLYFNKAEWDAFIKGVKNGEFDY